MSKDQQPWYVRWWKVIAGAVVALAAFVVALILGRKKTYPAERIIDIQNDTEKKIQTSDASYDEQLGRLDDQQRRIQAAIVADDAKHKAAIAANQAKALADAKKQAATQPITELKKDVLEDLDDPL